MLYIACRNPKCAFAIQVTGNPEDIDELLSTGTQVLLCPECRAACTEATSVDDAVLKARTFRPLTPVEAHLALSGMGYPDERDCTLTTLAEVLTGKRILRVHLRPIQGTKRCTLEHLTLEDGTTVFIAGSGCGATIYRVRKPTLAPSTS